MRALSAPGLQASVPDLEFAHTVLLVGVEPLDDAPILDLRIRKGVRRNGVKLAIASARPSTLDRNAALTARYAPGDEGAFLAELEAALAGTQPQTPAGELAGLLRDGGEDVVIVYGERIGEAAARSLLRIADVARARRPRRRRAAGDPRPAPTAAGCARPACVPDAGPGFAPLTGEAAGRDAAGIARAAADGELTALYLFGTDPIRDQPDRALWEAALGSAALVVAHASVMTEGLREHATVIFPAESHAEKEGTVVHPDGRLQRLRMAIAAPRRGPPGWAVLAELERRAGGDFGVDRSADAFAQLVEAVPFYAGLTLEAIAGQGIRWPEADGASAEFPSGRRRPGDECTPLHTRPARPR